jgi:YVTN family beta-propeller protein
VNLTVPFQGPADGGSTITIYGSNFRSGASVTVGGTAIAPGAVTLNSSTQITVGDLPAGSPAVVDITVTNADSSSGSCSRCFTYTLSDSDYAYIADGAGLLSGMSLSNNSLEKQCVQLESTVNSTPVGIAMSADGTKLFVAEQGLLDNPSYVVEVDLTSAAVSSTYPCGSETAAARLASQPIPGLLRMIMSADAHYLYFTTNGGTLYRLDATSFASAPTTLTLPKTSSLGLAASPDGSTIYVANDDPLNAGFTVASFAGPSATFYSTPFPLAEIVASPQFPEAFAAAGDGTGKLAVIDTSTPAYSSFIQLPAGNLGGVAISPDGSTIYIKQQNSSSVAVINAASRSLLRTVPVGFSGPSSLAVTADGAYLFAGDLADFPYKVGVFSASAGPSATVSTALSGSPYSILLGPTIQGPQTITHALNAPLRKISFSFPAALTLYTHSRTSIPAARLFQVST